MRAWEEYRRGSIMVAAVPAKHPGRRYSVTASDDEGALGYVIRFADDVVYYSGDTQYFDGFAEIKRRYAPTIAILNVNRHLDSDDAARAVEELGVRRVIPAHFGAFDHPLAVLIPGWHEELSRTAGRAWRKLSVGESLDLESILDDP
jgi:L-ascorbate metabolism protein UlaG (beta-lactamase superfamily)